MKNLIDDRLLGTDHAAQPVRVGDFRQWGFWAFLRIEQLTEFGAALARFLKEPTDDEIRHANYAEIKPESITEIKRNALTSGLDPSATLSAEFARAESVQDFEWSAGADRLSRTRSFS